jgi:uncharacterized protein (DUF58 family)
MTGVAFAAILLLLLGTYLDVPVAVILSIVVLTIEIVRQVWTRFGLSGVTYRRRLERDRVTWGEEIATTVEVWNRKRLPLSWLRADDDATPGVVVRERDLAIGRQGGRVLRNAWSLAPFERVVRHYHVGADRRGVYEIGPVELSVGDLFAREAASEERDGVDRFLVRPRTVPAAALHRRDTWGGNDRARFGLTEDPSRFAGIREYAPGDPLRRVHPRASARLGRPVVKRFEPSRDREVLIALDVQTLTGPAWEATFDAEEVEALFVVAASLARSLAIERAAFGLAAAGYHGAESRFAILSVSEAPGQGERVLDLLARLSAHPSARFERLLGMVARVVRPGTTLLVVTARDPSPYLGHLRRMQRAGFPVVVVACGPNGAADAGRARAAGLTARSARLNGPWRTASHLAVAG